MLFSRWLRNWMIGPAARRSLPDRQQCRPQLEVLEDRLCPSYTVIDLGGFSFPSSVNESGQVVGQDANTRAVLWQNGVMTDLGTLGEDSSAANDINGSGQVVGAAGGLLAYGDEHPPSHAFLWQNGVMTDIGGSQANAINNAGQIVGGSFVWEGGVMYNLNSLLPAGASLNLSNATDINDHGQIVGTGYRADGHERAFLLTDDDGIFANGGAVVTDLGFDVDYYLDYLPTPPPTARHWRAATTRRPPVR